MSQTKIPWTNAVANPFPGCKKVSPGCLNCYAEAMAKRLKGKGHPAYQDVVDEHGWTGKVGYSPHCMLIPGRNKLVFVDSMGDMGYEAIPQNQFNLVLDRIQAQPEHRFQILTKRPESLAEKLRQCCREYGEAELREYFPNLWLGVTVENPDYLWRIERLLQIPAAARFVSLEPLLGPVDLGLTRQPNDEDYRGWDGDGPIERVITERAENIHWLIIGCESGPKRRPCHLEWIDSLVRQAHAAIVPVFVKQINVKGKVIHNPNTISNVLAYPVESIRQFPRPA